MKYVIEVADKLHQGTRIEDIFSGRVNYLDMHGSNRCEKIKLIGRLDETVASSNSGLLSGLDSLERQTILNALRVYGRQRNGSPCGQDANNVYKKLTDR